MHYPDTHPLSVKASKGYLKFSSGDKERFFVIQLRQFSWTRLLKTT